MASGGASGRSVRIYGSGTVFCLYEKDEKQDTLILRDIVDSPGNSQNCLYKIV